MFARCNYKGFDAPHFNRCAGLSVDRERYSPCERRTAILRYLHLIEGLFEPPLESVRRFAWQGDVAVSNLESPGWQARRDAQRTPLLSGVLRYIDDLAAPDWFDTVTTQADRAWRDLRKVVSFPDARLGAALQMRDRSRDFGRSEVVQAAESAPPASVARRLVEAKSALWKEGAVASLLPALRWPLQAAIELAHCSRSVSHALRRLVRR